jgi:hypothetical protein
MQNGHKQFNIDISSISDEDFVMPEKKSKFVQKFFNVGRYEGVTIKSAEEGAACSDPTWFSLKVTFKQEEKEIMHFINIPTMKLTFTTKEGKESTFAFKNLQFFLSSCGIDTSKEKLNDNIRNLFNDLSVLEGVKVDIVVGHRDCYANYISKDRFQLFDSNNKPILAADGVNPLEFPNKEAAQSFCVDQLKIPFSVFPRVLSVYPSKTNSKNVKLEAKKTKKEVSLPW